MFALEQFPFGNSFLCSMSFLTFLTCFGIVNCGTEQPPSFQDGTVQHAVQDAGEGADAVSSDDGVVLKDSEEQLVDGWHIQESGIAGEELRGIISDEGTDDASEGTKGPTQSSDGVDAEAETDGGSSIEEKSSAGTNFNPEVSTVSDGSLYMHTLSLTQAEASKVDILWVIDSSGSMQKAQQYLGANLNSFITGLASSSQDFQTAVTSTDICGDSYPDLNRPCPLTYPEYLGSPATNLRGDFVGDDGHKILKHNDPDLVEKFNSYAQVGINGAGWEHGLKATEMAI